MLKKLTIEAVLLLLVGGYAICENLPANSREKKELNLANTALRTGLAATRYLQGEYDCDASTDSINLALDIIASRETQESLTSLVEVARFQLDAGLFEDYVCFVANKGEAAAKLLHNISGRALYEKCASERNEPSYPKNAGDRLCVSPNLIDGRLAGLESAVINNSKKEGDEPCSETSIDHLNAVKNAERAIVNEVVSGMTKKTKGTCGQYAGPNSLWLGITLLGAELSYDEAFLALAELARFKLSAEVAQTQSCLLLETPGRWKAVSSQLNPELLRKRCLMEYEAVNQTAQLNSGSPDSACESLKSIEQRIQELNQLLHKGKRCKLSEFYAS